MQLDGFFFFNPLMLVPRNFSIHLELQNIVAEVECVKIPASQFCNNKTLMRETEMLKRSNNVQGVKIREKSRSRLYLGGYIILSVNFCQQVYVSVRERRILR